MLTVAVSCLARSVTILLPNLRCQLWLHGNGYGNTANTSGKTSACQTSSPIRATDLQMLRSIKVIVWRFVTKLRAFCIQRVGPVAQGFELQCCETNAVWQTRTRLAWFGWEPRYPINASLLPSLAAQQAFTGRLTIFSVSPSCRKCFITVSY